jgi:hypothetical protein
MKSSVISECGLYRYQLGRRWAWNAYSLVAVMLNPSTADAQRDDPTIRRVVKFAEREGYGGILVHNLFAYRATDPQELATAADPVGPENDAWLLRVLRASVAARQPVLAAWGASGLAKERAAVVARLAPGVQWVCLGTTRDGSPWHPLYVRADQPMVPFQP